MNAPAKGLQALPLKDAKLFREQCYIDGEWVGGKKSFAVNNPATGALDRKSTRLNSSHRL